MTVENRRQKDELVSEAILIGEALTPRNEKVTPADYPELPYIGLANIEAHSMRLLSTKPAASMKSFAKRFYLGDVLYSRLRPYLNKVWPSDRNGICSSEFIVIPGNQFVDPNFLALRLNAMDFVSFANSLNAGDRPRVDFVDISSFYFPPFSLSHQRRIVAKIEELFSELDTGVENLKKASRQLAVYRQSVLQHAFEGKLTMQWRKENKDKLGTREQSLAHIKRERSACYEQQLKEWKAAVAKWEEGGKSGIRPSKPAGFKSQVPIELSELTELPAIPQLWQYVRLSEIALIGSGMSVSKSRKLTNPFQVPYLSVANVQRGELDLSTVKTMEIEHAQLPRLALRRWDVLFNEGGDRDKLGRGWVWEAQIEPCITQNHVFRASPFFESHSHSKWISHWGNTFGQLYFEAQGKQTTNLASINKTVLSRFPIPVPPVAEQEEIIRRLESQLAIVDHLDREVTSSLGQLGALRQSILKKAFSGQLVSQDPHDEPASVLLDRIRAERKQKAKSGIVRRRTKKKRATR